MKTTLLAHQMYKSRPYLNTSWSHSRRSLHVKPDHPLTEMIRQVRENEPGVLGLIIECASLGAMEQFLIKDLFIALAANTEIKDVILQGGFHLTDQLSHELANSIKYNPNLQGLFLDNLNISRPGLSVIAEALRDSQSISSIKLSEIQLDDYNATGFAQSIKCMPKLKCIEFNGIDTSAALTIAKALPNNNLEFIKLSGNKMDDAAAEVVAEAIFTNDELYCVDLSCNKIGYAGVRALAAAAQLRPGNSFIGFHLNDNNISVEQQMDIFTSNLILQLNQKPKPRF